MYINIHTHQKSNNPEVIEVINTDRNSAVHFELPQYYSLGVHPWDITPSYTETIKTITEINKAPNFIAIGECGLDKRKGPELSIQQDVFKKQIQLSEELQKPLIIHCVKSYSEIIKLRKDIQPTQAWVFHGFNASKETMEQALKQDFYFSLGDALLHPQTKALQSLPFIPLNRLFLETDDNPQLSIISVFKKASATLNLETPQLQVFIQDNFKRLFNVD